MSWVDEIGKEKFTERQARLAADVLNLLVKSSEADDFEEISDTFIESADIAIYNLKLLKSIMKDNNNGQETRT